MLYVLVVAQILGAATSLNALLRSRTPQGTVAWMLALNAVPLIAVPAYWVLGRNRFHGYLTEVEAMFEDDFGRAKPMKPGDFERRGLWFSPGGRCGLPLGAGAVRSHRPSAAATRACSNGTSSASKNGFRRSQIPFRGEGCGSTK